MSFQNNLFSNCKYDTLSFELIMSNTGKYIRFLYFYFKSFKNHYLYRVGT